MKIDHPLLKRAKCYRRRELDLAPKGCVYDDSAGAWRTLETGGLLADSPDRIGPRTKKNDIETGEDQKGE